MWILNVNTCRSGLRIPIALVGWMSDEIDRLAGLTGIHLLSSNTEGVLSSSLLQCHESTLSSSLAVKPGSFVAVSSIETERRIIVWDPCICWATGSLNSKKSRGI